jgi:hypothetical protein
LQQLRVFSLGQQVDLEIHEKQNNFVADLIMWRCWPLNCFVRRWQAKMATRKSHSHSTSQSKGKRKVHKVMKEHKEGKLKSSSGKKVTSRKQAVAIALNEARESGAKIPRKRKSS